MNTQSKQFFDLKSFTQALSADPSAPLPAVAYKQLPRACLHWARQQSNGATQRRMNVLICSSQPTPQTPGWAGAEWGEVLRGILP